MSSLPRHRDLVGIWRYIRKERSQETADRVESTIRSKFLYRATKIEATAKSRCDSVHRRYALHQPKEAFRQSRMNVYGSLE